MSRLEEIFTAIENGQDCRIVELVETALQEGLAPERILEDGMIAALDGIGEKYVKGQIFVPEMLIAARAMRSGMEALKPHLNKVQGAGLGKVIMGTVTGDLHDIGKNLVAMMMESVGFQVVDLGVDVPPRRFIKALEQHPDAKIVTCSVLLTTGIPAMKDTVAALNAHPNRAYFHVMVGGAPVTAEFAKAIGADAYTDNAGAAARMAKKLIGK